MKSKSLVTEIIRRCRHQVHSPQWIRRGFSRLASRSFARDWVKGSLFVLLLGGLAPSGGAVINQLKITGISLLNGNVTVRWQGGAGPYQLLCRTSLADAWRNVGQPTTGFSVTNAAPPGSKCFYTVSGAAAAAVPSGKELSAIKLGGTGADLGQTVAVDGSGNVFVGGSTAAHPFVAKCSPSNSLLWSLSFAGAGSGSVQAVAADASGNVFVTGNFYGTLDFGGGPLISAGGYDIFVAKFSSAGAHLWSKRFGSSVVDTFVGESGYGIAVDPVNNTVVVIGVFEGILNFGGGLLASASGQDVFLVKFSSTGAHLWSKRIGGAAVASGNGVEIDLNGNIFITGSFGLTVDFGSGPVTSAGTSDMFIAKYAPSGACLWAEHFGNAITPGSLSTGAALALDRAGNAVVTGNFQSSISFGIPVLTNAGFCDIFVAKFSAASGANLWAKRFGGGSYDYGYGVAVDPAGDITLIGRMGSSVDFGGGPLPAIAGVVNAFVANFAADGTHRWSKNFGVGLGDAKAVAIDAAGHSFVTGRFTSSVDFGGGSITSIGNTDVFVAEFAP